MIIPIKCFTCNKVLADKWEYYLRESTKLKKDAKKEQDGGGIKEQGTKEILDALGLDKYCCRRHMLGHVDIIDNL